MNIINLLYNEFNADSVEDNLFLTEECNEVETEFQRKWMPDKISLSEEEEELISDCRRLKEVIRRTAFEVGFKAGMQLSKELLGDE